MTIINRFLLFFSLMIMACDQEPIKETVTRTLQSRAIIGKERTDPGKAKNLRLLPPPSRGFLTPKIPIKFNIGKCISEKFNLNSNSPELVIDLKSRILSEQNISCIDTDWETDRIKVQVLGEYLSGEGVRCFITPQENDDQASQNKIFTKEIPLSNLLSKELDPKETFDLQISCEYKKYKASGRVIFSDKEDYFSAIETQVVITENTPDGGEVNDAQEVKIDDYGNFSFETSHLSSLEFNIQFDPEDADGKKYKCFVNSLMPSKVTSPIDVRILCSKRWFLSLWK